MTGVGRVPILLTVFAASLFPQVASANDQNIQRLYYMCQKPDGSIERTICAGYISGIADVMLLFAAKPKNTDTALDAFSMCGTPSHGAMVQAFVNWAEQHPEEWEKPQAAGVIIALRLKWPCP
jgi:hypothetical protein